MVNFITAENVTWSKEEVSVDKFIFVTEYFDINNIKIPTMSKPTFEVLNWLEENNVRTPYTQKVDSLFNSGIPRITDRIFCRKDQNGKYYVIDGNGRLMYALLHDQKSVSAYVGVFSAESPVNFWVPTRLLLDLSKLFKNSILTLDEYTRIIKSIFKSSNIAVIEYRERVSDSNEVREKIFSGIN